MHSFLQSRLSSFKNAFEGIFAAFNTEKNLLIHSTVSLLVIVVAFWLSLSPQDWAILILTMATVFAAEFFNTSIEATIDLLQPEFHPLAKTGKDVAAAAVLLTAIASVIIGLLIIGPPLCLRLNLFTPH